MTYKITVDRKYIEIDANDEVISFVNNYFDGYYSVEPSNKNGPTEDRIIKIVEMREKPNADEIELIQKSGFKEILIHYNQKAKLYDSGDKKWLFYEKLNHIVSIKDGIIYYYLNTEDVVLCQDLVQVKMRNFSLILTYQKLSLRMCSFVYPFKFIW